LTIWRAEEDVTSGLEAIPGEIISVGSDSIVVATGRGRFALFEMELDGTDMEATIFSRELGIVVGDRLRGLSEV